MAELDILPPDQMASASQTRLRGSGGGRGSLSPSQRDPPRVNIRPKWGGLPPTQGDLVWGEAVDGVGFFSRALGRWLALP